MALNETGGYVWKRIQSGDAIAEIARDLADETGTDPDVVGCDVLAFIEDLRSKELLTR